MNKAVWSPGWREQVIEQLQSQPKTWDVIVIGGGITGAGILREAVKLGLKTLLIERNDFAWGTSSRSSKMVHGGLRYLGSGQLLLTYHAVKERQRLLNEAPDLVQPLNYLMTHYGHDFPGPFLFNRLLSIYDWMAGQHNHQFINDGIADFFAPGIKQHQLQGATQFADAVTDDARLVMRVLDEATQQGGTALNYVSAQGFIDDNDGKVGRVKGVILKDQLSGISVEVQANVVINASGVWTDQLREKLSQHKVANQHEDNSIVIRPLRGSHLIFPAWRLPAAYSISFFHPSDRRLMFIFPWQGVTVIGTTDIDHQQAINAEPYITQSEVDYLLAAINSQFPSADITEQDVISSYSGVRPVVGTGEGKPSDEKRDHFIWDDQGVISVAGGKLTTFRLIALDVLKIARAYLPDLKKESDDSRIFKSINIEQLNWPSDSPLTTQQKKRLVGRYGEAAPFLINNPGDAHCIVTTDTHYGELRWVLEHETVIHLEDLLLRRTRLGLLLKDGAAIIFNEIKPLCQEILGWDDARWQQELLDYQRLIKRCYSLPSRRLAEDNDE